MKKNVVCIKWGNKFGADYVNSLYRMVEKNLTIPHRFVCFTDNAEGIDPNLLPHLIHTTFFFIK